MGEEHASAERDANVSRIEDSHSALVRLRKECVARFGNGLGLPIIPSRPAFLRNLYKGGHVLDVGAGAGQPLKAELGLNSECYSSLDVDPLGHFTYHTWDEVPPDARYALVTANQVLEHLDLRDASQLIQRAAGHLELQGIFVCTTPNMLHPTRYWGDPTHRSTWNYADLYALCASAGLSVKHIVRYSRQQPKGFVNRFLARRISTLFNIDWCDSILLVAAKQEHLM